MTLRAHGRYKLFIFGLSSPFSLLKISKIYQTNFTGFPFFHEFRKSEICMVTFIGHKRTNKQLNKVYIDKEL